MPGFRLITFDAYAGLADQQTSLLPVIKETLDIGDDAAVGFLATWRAKQLEAAQLSNALARGRVSFHECTARGLDYALFRHGAEVTAARREALVAAWYPLKPWAEANDVLGELRRRGYPLAILSNGDRAMLEAIAGGLSVTFDYIFSTESIGVYKPAPAVYELPIDALGIGRGDYLHVAGGAGDVVGARSAGVACYWNNRNGDRVLYPEYAADFEGPDLRGLLDVV